MTAAELALIAGLALVLAFVLRSMWRGWKQKSRPTSLSVAFECPNCYRIVDGKVRFVTHKNAEGTPPPRPCDDGVDVVHIDCVCGSRGYFKLSWRYP